MKAGFGAVEARRESEILVASLLGLRDTELFTKERISLTQSQADDIAAKQQRRAQGEPMAYILEERGFYGLTFRVGPGVLIPRPETELLVATALGWAEKIATKRMDGGANYAEVAPISVLDLCTGSGCVILSIGANWPPQGERAWPELRLVAQDVSPFTRDYFADNATALGLEKCVSWYGGDLFEQINGCFDIIVANPPYIGRNQGPRADENVVKYEPDLALFSGDDGLELVRRIVAEAPTYLKPSGCLALEIGCEQGDEVKGLMQAASFVDVEILTDFSGLDRVVHGCFQAGNVGL